MNLAEALEINAHGRPDHTALIEGPRQITHEAFAARVRELSAAFTARGIRPADLVGVCLKDSIDHLAVNYALARLGIVILPMDWRWTEGEKSRVAEHFQAACVIAEEGDSAGGAALLTIAELAGGAAAAPGAIVAGENLPLLLSLSSGTTGRPRGPRITHQQMLRRFWTHWINLGLNSSDRYVSATPLYFGGGRTFAMSVLFAGGTVAMFPPPFEPQGLLAELDRVGATSTFLVPTQLRKLLELSDADLAPMRRLRLLISSGAPLDPAERTEITARLCSNFIEYYASTEGGGVSISTAESRETRPESVGRPVFGVEAEVVGGDHLPLPAGGIGAFRYRGPGVATEYFNDPEASGSAFRDGWFYPGDLAEIDAAGFITLRGRSKDMVIRGGVNIYPGEVETVLREHPDVVEASVVGRPSKRFGEEIAAFLLLRRPVGDAALAAWCAERLAPYKVPRDFIVVEDLPRNSAGKVIKSELVQRLTPL